MREVYRKVGRSVRYEHGHLITVIESGEAVEEGNAFTARPWSAAGESPALHTDAVEGAVARIHSAVRHPLSIERLVVSEGTADHELGDIRWTETTRRVHAAIVFGRYRALIDLGDFDTGEIERVAEALPRLGGERNAPERVVLEPRVTAALIPNLIGLAPPNVTMLQTAGGQDGKGMAIEEVIVDKPPFPNWYRPSYRVRPQRAPLNVRATCTVTEIEPGVPRAIALLAPPHGLTMRVLIHDGNEVYASTVRVDRVDAISPVTRWYPHAAGSFGALMTVV